MHSSSIDELALLTLQEYFSLSVLMHAMAALILSNTQIDELGVCWNSVIRKIFGYNKWESVKSVLCGLGRLNVKHLIMLRKVRFYRHLYYAQNSLLSDIFYMFLMQYSERDVMLKTVLWTASNAVQHVWSSFRCYVDM